MTRAMFKILDAARNQTQGIHHVTYGGCPCVLMEHEEVVYSFVFMRKYQRFVIYNNFGNELPQKRVPNVRPENLHYIVDRIERGIF